MGAAHRPITYATSPDAGRTAKPLELHPTRHCAQVWVHQSNGEYLNPQSGRCLDDTGWGGSGTQVQIWDCAGGANQQWSLP
ncbi:RICIN domain-containing protein [Actinocrinis puniceicyclus]|uniref:RICIN domain-containing protein n=1 Tax=Actinocrinis puniceicyclus TaxID=977794 RepID=A0A8J8BCH2_9ACTN|nr:RICIN domain-containing protein [Actinocrinis puniceicyclus]MBS2963520.1 RICIN domain-containing protein [Actinocrinis puniceicyclus]